MYKLAAILCIAMLHCHIAKSQKYQHGKVRIGIGAGVVDFMGRGSGDGLLINVEPSYRLRHDLLVGVRCEVAVGQRGATENLGLRYSMSTVASYTLFLHYYLGSGAFRPFVGAGVGLYQLSSINYEDPVYDKVLLVRSSSVPGFYPKIGFDLEHFTFSIDYNLLPKVQGLSNVRFYGNAQFINSYGAFRIGFSIGGGRLKKSGYNRR